MESNSNQRQRYATSRNNRRFAPESYTPFPSQSFRSMTGSTSNFEERISSNRLQTSQAADTNDYYESRISQLNQEISQLKWSIKQKTKTNSTLAQDKRHLEAQCTDLNEELAERDSELEDLKQSKEQETYDLREKLYDMEDQNKYYIFEEKKYREKYEQIQKENASLTKNSQAELDRLNAELEQCNEKLAKFEEENCELNQINERNSVESQQKLDQMTRKNEANANKFAKLNEIVEELKREHDREMKDNSSKISELMEKNTKLEEENEMLKADHKVSYFISISTQFNRGRARQPGQYGSWKTVVNNGFLRTCWITLWNTPSEKLSEELLDFAYYAVRTRFLQTFHDKNSQLSIMGALALSYPLRRLFDVFVRDRKMYPWKRELKAVIGSTLFFFVWETCVIQVVMGLLEMSIIEPLWWTAFLTCVLQMIKFFPLLPELFPQFINEDEILLNVIAGFFAQYVPLIYHHINRLTPK